MAFILLLTLHLPLIIYQNDFTGKVPERLTIVLLKAD